MLFCLHVLLDRGLQGLEPLSSQLGNWDLKRTEGDIIEQNEGMDVTLSELR